MMSSPATPRQGALEAASTCFGRFTFSHMTPLIALGAKRVLEADDLGCLMPKDSPNAVMEQWEGLLDKHGPPKPDPDLSSEEEKKKTKKTKKTKPNTLWSVVWRFELWSLMGPAGLCKLCGDLCGYVAPLSLPGLVGYIRAVKVGASASPQLLFALN